MNAALAVKGEAAILGKQGFQGQGNRCPAGLMNGVTLLCNALCSGMAFIK